MLLCIFFDTVLFWLPCKFTIAAHDSQTEQKKRARFIFWHGAFSLPGQGTPYGQYIAKKTFCESNEAASGVSSLRFASCASSERSEGSLAGQRSFAPLRMTKPDSLLFEMDCPLWVPCSLLNAQSTCMPQYRGV